MSRSAYAEGLRKRLALAPEPTPATPARTPEVFVCSVAGCGGEGTYGEGRAGLKDQPGTWWCSHCAPARLKQGRAA